jgi:hypothetical protein
VSPPSQAKTSPTGDERNHLRTLLTLVPYLWPQGEWGLRARVVVSLGLLVFAKGANVLVPLAFARAVDALAPQGGAGAGEGEAARHHFPKLSDADPREPLLLPPSRMGPTTVRCWQPTDSFPE